MKIRLPVLIGVGVATLLTRCRALHALTEKDIATLDVAYFYNFKFYDKAVEKGSLENLGKIWGQAPSDP